MFFQKKGNILIENVNLKLLKNELFNTENNKDINIILFNKKNIKQDEIKTKLEKLFGKLKKLKFLNVKDNKINSFNKTKKTFYNFNTKFIYVLYNYDLKTLKNLLNIDNLCLNTTYYFNIIDITKQDEKDKEWLLKHPNVRYKKVEKNIIYENLFMYQHIISEKILNIKRILGKKELIKNNNKIIYKYDLINIFKTYFEFYAHYYREKESIFADHFDRTDIVEYVVKDLCENKYYKIDEELVKDVLNEYLKYPNKKFKKHLENKTFKYYEWFDINQNSLDYLLSETVVDINKKLHKNLQLKELHKLCEEINLHLLNLPENIKILIQFMNYIYPEINTEEIMFHKFEKWN